MVELAVIKTWPPLQICRSPVEIRASVQIQGQSLQLQLQKNGKLWNHRPQIQNCKITQQIREENCKTESRAMSTTIWYSRFTITVRNIIIIIPWNAIVQIISSCTHICNMQIVHLAYHHHVLTCNMQIMHLIYHTHVPTPATGTIVRY